MSSISRLAIFSLTVAVLLAADDPWTKVKQLKSGTEIRVMKKGSMQPVLGKIDEANDGNLILVVKNEQVAIPKEQVDRLDYRPPQTGSRITKETKVTTDDPNTGGEPRQGMRETSPGQGYSSSTTFSPKSKPDFETLYRRPPPGGKK